MSYSRVGLLILSISVIPVKSLTFFRYRKFGLKPRRFTTAFLDL